MPLLSLLAPGVGMGGGTRRPSVLLLDAVNFTTLILDRIRFNQGADVLVIGALTTGQDPLVVGSTYTFQLNGSADGQWWNLSEATVNCLLQPPFGPLQTLPTVIANGSPVTVPTTLVGPIGNWQRQWQVTMGGKPYLSNAIVFPVESSL